MKDLDSTFVYHGSPQKFDDEYANPKRNTRHKWNKEIEAYEVIFDQQSFHATSHKWIALAYTYKNTACTIDGQKIYYNMGVSLYDDTHVVDIFGLNSLEESLKVLYGNGGYVYHFDKSEFHHKEGLGTLEVIAEVPVMSVAVERIDDPVAEMKRLGVSFRFIDLALPENRIG